MTVDGSPSIGGPRRPRTGAVRRERRRVRRPPVRWPGRGSCRFDWSPRTTDHPSRDRRPGWRRHDRRCRRRHRPTLQLDLDVLQAIWRPSSDQLDRDRHAETARMLGLPRSRRHADRLRRSSARSRSRTHGVTRWSRRSRTATLGRRCRGSDPCRRHRHAASRRRVDFAPGVRIHGPRPTFSPDGERLLVHESDVDGYRPDHPADRRSVRRSRWVRTTRT